MTHDELVTLAEVVDDAVNYSLSDLCEICQLDRNVILLYVEYEVILAESTNDQVFSQAQLDRLLKAMRLQRDLEIDYAGVALALDLLDQVDDLKRQVAYLSKVSP